MECQALHLFFICYNHHMSINQYFRAGAGAVIYNSAGQILLLSRLDKPHVWQLQQGGMDEGETVEETLWRELKEETSIDKDEVTDFHKFPTWLSYEYPDHIRKGLRDYNTIGQIHSWYYLKATPEIEIDISSVEHPEFAEWRWGSFAELLESSDTLKHEVYKKLSEYFDQHIKPNL